MSFPVFIITALSENFAKRSVPEMNVRMECRDVKNSGNICVFVHVSMIVACRRQNTFMQDTQTSRGDGRCSGKHSDRCSVMIHVSYRRHFGLWGIVRIMILIIIIPWSFATFKRAISLLGLIANQ